MLSIVFYQMDVSADGSLLKFRLFYSPAQRQSIDIKAGIGSEIPKEPAINPSAMPAKSRESQSSIFIFNGVLHTSQRDVLWVNGIPWKGDKSFGGVGTVIWQPDSQRLLVKTTNGQAHWLKPGDSLTNSSIVPVGEMVMPK